MKRKLIINLLFVFCIRLFATPTDELYSKLIERNDRFWIPEQCIKVLASNDKQKIKEYYPDIEKLNFYHELEDRYIYWDEFECFSNFCIVQEYDFTNDALCITFGDSDSLLFYFSNISRLNEKNFHFDIKKTYNCKKLENKNSFSQWPIKEDECEMILRFDEDYLYVYLNDINNLYGIFCKVNDKSIDEYNKLIRTGKCDLSKVTWPRHADGSCDYDGSKKITSTSQETKAISSKSSTNVSPNKTMLVKENLKLRSGEATSTQVLTVMSAGTKVKILELGKAEKIDGISSIWVKVEVQSDSKDRDGKTIKASTVGWCYGGYLE